MTRLPPAQQDFFRTYGFLVLPGVLSGDEATALREEVRDSLHRSFPVPSTPLTRPTGDDSFLLPMVGPATPASRALVSDRRLVDIAESLLGPGLAPKPAKGNLYRDASFWHCDSSDPHLRAIKVVTYFDELVGASGALQVMPGSQVPAVCAAMAGYRERWPWTTTVTAEAEEQGRWPGYVIQTRPGDLIVFDIRLWHASLGGRDRLQWSVSYVARPGNEAEREAGRAYVLSYLGAGHVYDATDYPYLDPDWATGGPFVDGVRALDLMGAEPG